MGYSPWGHKESDSPDRLTLTFEEEEEGEEEEEEKEEEERRR